MSEADGADSAGARSALQSHASVNKAAEGARESGESMKNPKESTGCHVH